MFLMSPLLSKLRTEESSAVLRDSTDGRSAARLAFRLRNTPPRGYSNSARFRYLEYGVFFGKKDGAIG